MRLWYVLLQIEFMTFSNTIQCSLSESREAQFVCKMTGIHWMCIAGNMNQRFILCYNQRTVPLVYRKPEEGYVPMGLPYSNSRTFRLW
jgi:hypothetical protein